MPLKILGCLLLVAAAYSAGALLAKRLYARRDFLNRFKAFLETMKTRLRFSGGDIFIVVQSCIDQTRLPMPFCGGSEPFEACWNKAVGGIPRFWSLGKADIELIYECGSQLGKTDLEGQLSHLGLIEARLDLLIAQAEENIGKKSKLYKTMGFFAGASAAILLM